jgi:hypothetical protein
LFYDFIKRDFVAWLSSVFSRNYLNTIIFFKRDGLGEGIFKVTAQVEKF